jgi:16S rRNA (cytosine967-C5)-methyltransferase
MTARTLAVSVLTDVTESGAYAYIALQKAFSRSGLETRNKSFVTELVNGTLRNLSFIDHIINHFSNTPTPRMKPFIRNLLRISVCQLRFMDRVPASAAVNEAVVMAKKYGFGNLSGFVNGVLRNIVRSPGKPETDAGDTGLRLSYPPWMMESLTHWLGAGNTLSFCENSHRIPAVSIFTNTLKITPEALAVRLSEEGITNEPGIFPECLRLGKTSDITALKAFKDGLFHVMDEGAVLAVKSLELTPGMPLIDLCAAPGGKSFAAACLMGGKGKIHAFDIHPHRVKLMEESKRRLGMACVLPQVGDALEVETEPTCRVLLDAPCSGLGIIRRRPDIKYKRKPEDIQALAEIQKNLLRSAAKLVKPGGMLLYCTCTVSKTENIDNVRWFINHFPFSVAKPFHCTAAMPPHTAEDDCLQLLPGAHNDGFFIARLVRDA